MAKSNGNEKVSLADDPLYNAPKFEVPIVSALRNGSDKDDDSFECNAVVASYKTGIPVLDYHLGYRVNVYDKNDVKIDSYPSIGITGGCFVTLIGKPSTSKTSIAVTIAANIVRQFENGFVHHFDLEQAMNYSRIQALTKFTMTQMQAGKYILRQQNSTINDIKKSIMQVYFEKTRNPDKYMYKTGKLNEFGEEIEIYQPTVVIIDSIPSLSTGYNENDKKDVARLEEVGSQTERMRITGEIGRFYTELMPYIRRANIIVISINQIKVKAQLGYIPEPAEILYLDQNESTPGGRAPQFYAHILLKFIAVGSMKFTEEDDGFDGYGVRVKVIKSRGNQSGRIFTLIYDMVRGVDSLRSTLTYAKDEGMLGGNKNATYFIDNKDMKFSMKKVHDEFRNNRGLYKLTYDITIPSLEKKLSMLTDEELQVIDEEMMY